MSPYSPSRWYWLIGGANVYSSARGAVIPATDATFQAWLAAGNAPTPIPASSDLDIVLESAGLPPTGLTAPTQAQLLSAAYAHVAALMSVARTYTVGTGVSIKCDGTPSTGADLAGINAWGVANPSATITWVDNFGAPTAITGAEGVSLAAQVIAYGQSVYNKLGAVATAIAGGTITTLAQVASAGWPT